MRRFLLGFLLATGLQAQELQPDLFPIGGYGPNPQRDKEAGFTIAGPVYGASRETILEESTDAGLPCIYPVGMPIHFYSQKEETPLDFEAIRREIRRQVGEVVESRSIHAWYLMPEELRFWRAQEMEYLQVASETIRESDPLKRPVWMYEPGHRTQEALERTLPFLQMAGKGVYTNYAGRRTERAWVPWTLRQQAQAIEAINPKALPYAVLEMYKTPEEVMSAEEIRQWVRHDAYASLVSGVRGIVIFSFGVRPGFGRNSEEWQTYYHAWSGVARELNGELKLGAVFLNGKRESPPTWAMVEGAKQEWLPESPSGPAHPEEVAVISEAAFLHQGQRYWIVVNSSNDPRRLRLASPAWKPLLEDQPRFETDGTTLLLPGLGVAVFSQAR